MWAEMQSRGGGGLTKGKEAQRGGVGHLLTLHHLPLCRTGAGAGAAGEG